MGISKMAVNARIGDGILGKGKNANITYISTDKLLLEHKERLLLAEGYEGIRWGDARVWLRRYQDYLQYDYVCF